MSASDHLGIQWYHGSSHSFEPGDMVDPRHEQDPDPSDKTGPHAYVSKSAGFSAGYGRVYHVEPTGPVIPVPHGASNEYQSNRPLRVVGRVR